MEKLLVKFNEKTGGEFDYLKLSTVNVYVKKYEFEFVFIYPAEKEREVNEKRDYIVSTLISLIRTTAKVNIKLKKSHFDFTFFKADFFAYLNKFPVLSSTLTDKDVSYREENGNIVVTLMLEESVYDYCAAQKISLEIDDFLSVNYCEKITVELISKGKTDIAVKDSGAAKSEYVLERPDEGRSIRPQNVEEFIGNIVYDLAGYIEDAKPKEYAVLCGTITHIFEQHRKPKENDEKDALREKRFYKFGLEDYTGKISCVYFPSKKTVEKFGLLKVGKQIVVRGRIEEDTYRGGGALSFMVRDISLCTLPESFAVNKIYRRAPDEYSVVFPKPYVVKEQSSLFDGEVARAPVPPYLIGKTFCVFDIETTGLDTDLCKIIEIGAVKIVNGVMTETFSTFIDPQEPLSDKIKKLTGIEDSDLKGQPLIDAVMPDFYKFTEGSVLVGHNVQFDFGFITVKAKPMQFLFDNSLLDTFSLARTYVPGLSNYKLGTIAKHFGVVNEGAHRAIFDALATAEVFIKLAEKLQ